MYHIDTNQLAILRRKHINHHGNLRFLHFYAKICEEIQTVTATNHRPPTDLFQLEPAMVERASKPGATHKRTHGKPPIWGGVFGRFFTELENLGFGVVKLSWCFG